MFSVLSNIIILEIKQIFNMKKKNLLKWLCLTKKYHFESAVEDFKRLVLLLEGMFGVYIELQKNPSPPLKDGRACI